MANCQNLYRSFLVVVWLCSLTLAQGRSRGPAIFTPMYRLQNHITGISPLTAIQINEQAAIIQENIGEIGASANTLAQAFGLVASYESTVGPLFMNNRTKGGFARNPSGGLELDRALLTVQQGLIDYAYTPQNLTDNRDVFNDARFGTASYFPGAVAPPANPYTVHTALVNASQPHAWGSPVMYDDKPARRPTGCYLAPGSIAVVTVPRSLVNNGFSVRVGAHSWDLVKKSQIKRLDRVSIVYPITHTETPIANPLGGGIYIEVPPEADAGIVEVQITNAVRAPFFSAKSFHTTTLSEWINTERHHPGPWADFESDKFMMQVPTSWIYNFADPVTLMRDWDKAMDVVSELFGHPLIRPKTVLYSQIDVILRGSANFPGYPMSNTPYNPFTNENGNKNNYWLKGPQYSPWTQLHELGHAHLFTKFAGETESTVNLPYVAVLNRGFGVDIDTAFGKSISGWARVSLDQAAIMWMVTDNFRQGNPMNISKKPGDEVKYQHRGHGKYVEIAKLFGWDALNDFWYSVQVDYMNGITYSRNSDPTDSRILRMSRAAGADLRPLIHFWGVQPENNAALQSALAAEGLQPSTLIQNKLNYYKTIIPMNNAAFAAHTRIIYPNGPKESKNNPYAGEGYYYVMLPLYNESHGQAAQAALQDIIDLYFPRAGRSISRTH